MVVPSNGFIGGIERHAHDLARGLSGRGHELTLVYGDLPGRQPTLFAEPFARAIPRSEAHTLRSGAAGRGADIVYVHRAASAAELVDFGPLPLVVVSHDHDLTCVRSHRYLPMGHAPCHRPPGLACFRHGCVVVRDRRRESRLPVTLKNPYLLRRRLRALAARAPLVSCSRYVRDQLVRAGVPRSRAHVIHPIPPEDDRPTVPRPKAPHLVCAGNLLRGKGVDIAIDAMQHLPADTELTIVGDGASRADLERQAIAAAPRRIRFVGWVPPGDIANFYDQASVVVVPSRWPEPFGMVGIEAMRRARPVVAAGHGGIEEWAGGTAGACTFAPGDARSLATAARTLLDNDDAGSAALLHAQERFPHARLLDEVEALLEKVAA
ncbi:MAG: glycosyltransferase family 4 protein [Deltaproteobacteria bacterium]|nr:glycosyltransferase family 4 protein [Deltaproteobacteria bacterium]